MGLQSSMLALSSKSLCTIIGLGISRFCVVRLLPQENMTVDQGPLRRISLQGMLQNW